MADAAETSDTDEDISITEYSVPTGATVVAGSIYSAGEDAASGTPMLFLTLTAVDRTQRESTITYALTSWASLKLATEVSSLAINLMDVIAEQLAASLQEEVKKQAPPVQRRPSAYL